jgi:hypothetical protein
MWAVVPRASSAQYRQILDENHREEDMAQAVRERIRNGAVIQDLFGGGIRSVRRLPRTTPTLTLNKNVPQSRTL